uniref:Activin_recp domain-containing protein n=1 Tax=Steinernema glaseri TaxID=37863 RepID=A0A1I8A9H4_9BILA
MGAFAIVVLLAAAAGVGYAYTKGLLDPYIEKAKEAAAKSAQNYLFRQPVPVGDSKMLATPFFLFALVLSPMYCSTEVFRYIQCFGKAADGGDNQSCNINSAEFCVTYPKKSGPTVCNTQITFTDNVIPSGLKHCRTEGCQTIQDWGQNNLFGTHCCCQSIQCDYPAAESNTTAEFDESQANETNIDAMYDVTK